MSQTAQPQSTNDMTLDVDLKDPRLAAFLAWLVPGLGHLYQGRHGKGVLFFVCIVGTFVYGMWLGGGRVVYASAPSPFTRWQYFCQLGVGLPALPALVQRERLKDGKGPLVADWFMRPPRMTPPPGMPRGFESTDEAGNIVRHPDEAAQWNHDYGDWFELGTVFTVIAGLLNLLAIFDAYGGPLVLPPPDDKLRNDETAPASALKTK
jgi:hypothetical protein